VNENITHAFEEYRKALKAEEDLTDEIQSRDEKAPTADDLQKFERIEADIDLWSKETKRLLKVAERSKEVDEVRNQFAALFTQSDKDERKAAKSDIEVLAGMFAQARSGQHVVMEEDDPENPFRVRASDVAKYATRALGSTGGSAVDSSFVNQVLFYEIDESPMLDPAVVQVITTARGEALTFPRLTADPVYAGTLTAEAAALTEADPTLSVVTLNAYKYGGITLWSAELDQDDVINIQSVIAQSAAREIVLQANSPLTTGDGSDKPNGIVTAAANGGTALGTAQTGGDNFFGWPDLVTLFHFVKPAYRRRGQWLTSSAALAKIRKFRDTTGNPIFLPGLSAGSPDTILGRPVHENPDMAAAASASKSVLFGDTQRYIVRRAGALRVEVSRDYKFSTDQLALKAVERLDGDLLDASAVAYLVSATT
jgi:HK97 family phage major capsid protein